MPARQSVLQPAGPIAEQTADMAWLLAAGAAVVFAIVMAVLAFALWRRRRDATRGPGDAAWLIGAGIAFPAVVLSALLWHTLSLGPRLALASDRDELVIGVTARMWWWDVRYQLPGDAAAGATVRSANEIRLPAGRTARLALDSGDVIHSFWVPALAGKVDMLPGRIHPLRVRADVPGVWRGQCAEFCGEQHARMALDVIVLEPAQFDAWLAAQARPAQASDDARIARGRAVYAAQRCASCHHIRGLEEGAALGPDLTHLASRLHLGAGTLPMNHANLAEWVAHVQRVKTGARMPSFDRLDAESLAALAAFLESLK